MSARQRQSRFDQGDDLVVMKFGGTSVEDANAIRRLIGIVQSRVSQQAVVVVSALARVTDQLLEAGHSAASGRLGAALEIVRGLYVRHESLADELVEPDAYRTLERELRKKFAALESLLRDLDYARELDPPTQDRLLSFGECMSSRLIEAALLDAGVKATHVDASACIVTNAQHGQAHPLWEETNERIQERLGGLLDAGRVPILGGFIASTLDGAPSTLGRGGSDFSAAIIAAGLSASRLEIWTDVDGVMTADPKLCPDARVIGKMSFEEAAELAHFGAKVLHPATIAPAMRQNIPVYVLNSRRPEGKGTEILARAKTGNLVSAITANKKVVAVEIESERLVDSEFLGNIYAVFSQYSCPVDLLAASFGRISLLVGSTAALPHIAAQLQGVADVRWENHKALVCLVGENIRRQPEVASRVFAAVSDLNVQVVCQGASDRTISFLVEEEKADESVQRLHALFFQRPEPLRDWGGISSAFCQAG